jgi:hypothetical protein
MEDLLHSVAKMIAVNFAEWLSKNKWQKRFKTHPNKVGMYWSHDVCEYKNIEDLYDMFEQDERKRLETEKNEN